MSQARRLPRSLTEQVFSRDGLACRYCQVACEFGHPDFGRRPSIEHIVSRANGGTDDLDNLCVACRSCNSAKGAAEDRTPSPRALRRHVDAPLHVLLGLEWRGT